MDAPLRSRFLSPALLRRLGRVELRARNLVEGTLCGPHGSRYRGDSVEFAEHRSYVPGDDTRHVDWKLYARRERYYVRQYHQETNLVATVLLDGSASMGFTSTRASKLEYACVVAAALVYLVLRQRDAAAVGLFDRASTAYLPPSRQMGFLARLAQLLERVESTGTSDIGAALTHFSRTSASSVKRRLDRRGIVAVISDFLDDPDAILAGLGQLRARGHDVLALHVLDPAELALPWRGLVRFEGLESGRRVLIEPPRIRRSYQHALHAHLQALRAGCSRAGIEYRLAGTQQPPEEMILAYLAARSRRRRTAR